MIYLRHEDAKQFHTEGTAIALGKFDGIHVGHQMLIDGLLKEKEQGKQALVFTFGQAPNEVLFGGVRKSIYTTEEKAFYFEKLGVDILLEYPFTKEFASCPPEEFVTECLVKQLGVSSIYVGEDFHFGRGRSGNVGLLKLMGAEYGFEVHAIPKKTLHGKVVSSTLIRDMIETKFYISNELLGNPYFIYGEVIHGNHLGRTIGYPTINQAIPEDKLIPALGVYSSRVWIDGVAYDGISNLGKKPTIHGTHQIGLETYILDFKEDVYHQKLQTELLCYIRPEEKFSNVEELTKQIKNDIEAVQNQSNEIRF